MRCDAIILAAGCGTRMNSTHPKVMLPLAGRPMIRWSAEACQEATGTEPYIVVPPNGEAIGEAAGVNSRSVEQPEPLGTAHAALQAGESIDNASELTLITSADMALLRSSTLRKLIEKQSKNSGVMTLLSATSEQSRGFGRILRNEHGSVSGIVEEQHATAEQLSHSELNVGAYCFNSEWLWKQLREIPRSPKGEYYLTDIVGLAAENGASIGVVDVLDSDEIIGINTMAHLAEAEAAARRRINKRWMEAGVRMVDPSTTYIDAEVEIGSDTVVLPNTHLLGRTMVGARCEVGPNSVLRDARVGEGCRVEASFVEGAVLDENVEVGPFARLRPGAKLGPGVHVGNFGEIKNSTLAAGVKVGHFSYLGDATIGTDANIGAGTITCNYDGKKKNATTIGADAFIGSDTMLVAPVDIGAGAHTGAGAVVTKDVPERTLAAGVPARVIRKLDPDD